MGSKKVLYVPGFFLQDERWFSDRRRRCKYIASEHVGHILIHFLYTGEYQTLKIDDTNSDESEAFTELRIAVQVLLALGSWRLPRLEELVHSKIESLCKSIHVYDTLRLVDEVLEKDLLEYPEDQEDQEFMEYTENQEEWLEDFLMTSLNEALENNDVDRNRDDLTLFDNLRHTRLIKFFAASFFGSYISNIPVKNKMDGQEQYVGSQDSDSFSAVSDIFS